MCTKKKKGTMAFPQGQKSPWQKEVKYLEKWTVRLKNEVNQIKFYFIKINNSLLLILRKNWAELIQKSKWPSSVRIIVTHV